MESAESVVQAVPAVLAELAASAVQAVRAELGVSEGSVVRVAPAESAVSAEWGESVVPAAAASGRTTHRIAAEPPTATAEQQTEWAGPDAAIPLQTARRRPVTKSPDREAISPVRARRIGLAANPAAEAMHPAYQIDPPAPATVAEAVSGAIQVWEIGAVAPAAAIDQAALATAAAPAGLTADRAGVGAAAEHA